jgi:protein disulfide-isomerase
MVARLSASGLVLLVSLLASIAAAQDDGLRWEADLETAQRLAAESNRLVLIHFGGPWCPPCATLERDVFGQAGFGRDLTSDFVAVKVDPRVFPTLNEKYNVYRYPSDVIVTPQGQVVYKLLSPKTDSGYVAAMRQVADEAKAKGLIQSHRAADKRTQAAERDGRYAAANSNTDARQETVVPNRYASRPPRDQRDRRPIDEPGRHRSRYASETTGASNVNMETSVDSPKQPVGQEALEATVQLPPGSPPLVLDGYCPVSLREKKAWVAGNVRWGAIHHRHTYLFAGEAEQRAFLADPESYAPILDGIDPVLALDRNQAIPGKREFGGRDQMGRLYLFASEETLKVFNQHRERYSIEIRQARRTPR